MARPSRDPRLIVREFFEKDEAQDQVRRFMLEKRLSQPVPSPCQSDSSELESSAISINRPEPLVLRFELGRCCSLRQYEKPHPDTALAVDIDIFGKRERYDTLPAAPCFRVGKVIKRPLPDDFEIMIAEYHPLRICLCETAPQNRFVALALIEWRNALKTERLHSQVQLIGLCNEIVGTLEYSLEIQSESSLDFETLCKSVGDQLRQEQIDAAESEQNFGIDLRVWWKDATRLAPKNSLTIRSREIGTGKTIIFGNITPFSIRELRSPGECLRFCYHFTPLGMQSSAGCLPNWAVIASRCAGDREKLNLFVSLLRGFHLTAFVLVGSPRCCAISLADGNAIFYDVSTGKFDPKMPQVITSVSYLYNEMSLFANLRPGLELTKLDWEIGNPLKWKLLDPPTDVIYLQPSILENESDWLNDRVTQFQVKQIIASERSSFGLETKWNLEFEKALYSIAASYEFEYIAGKRGDLGDLQISALKSKLRSLHSLKAAPTVVQTADPCDIFRALMKTTYGLDILSVREPTASFALVTRAHAYPEGIFCIWTIFAVESMIGFL